MKRSFILTMAFLALTLGLRSQEDQVLTLTECYTLAEQNHPLSRQVALIEEASRLELENLDRNYYPMLSLNGKVSYQSDVTKVPSKLPIPGLEIPAIDKDWYNMSLDLQQPIYEAGATARQKDLRVSDKAIQQQEVNIDLYTLKGQINRVYFNVLIIQENMSILALHKQTLQKRIDEIASFVRHGSLLETNLKVLQAEMMRIEQKEAELLAGLRSAKGSLEKLIGTSIPENMSLSLPADEPSFGLNERKRPEYDLISKQQLRLVALGDLTKIKDRPTLVGFGQAGIGRPALDMLNNNFDPYYIVGLKLNWNFWNWGRSKRERDILTLNREMLENRKESLDQAISIEMVRELAEFNKYEELIRHDSAIVEMRSDIVQVYESQLNNGVISSTEYLAELNAASEARLNLAIHRILMVQAGIGYLTTIGENQ